MYSFSLPAIIDQPKQMCKINSRKKNLIKADIGQFFLQLFCSLHFFK